MLTFICRIFIAEPMKVANCLIQYSTAKKCGVDHPLLSNQLSKIKQAEIESTLSFFNAL